MAHDDFPSADYDAWLAREPGGDDRSPEERENERLENALADALAECKRREALIEGRDAEITALRAELTELLTLMPMPNAAPDVRDDLDSAGKLRVDAQHFLMRLAQEYHGTLEDERCARVLRFASGAIARGAIDPGHSIDTADVAARERRVTARELAALRALGRGAAVETRLHTDDEYRRRQLPKAR